jgi:hypothetical protein
MARIASEIIYKLIGDDKDLQKAFTDSKKSADELAKKLSSTGAALTKGLTLPIVAAGAAAVKFAIEAGKAADRILDLEQITGLSTDTLQEFKNVAAVAGVDFESLVGTLGRFTGRLSSIDKEGGPAADAVKRLGINIRDSNGELRSTEDLFPEFLEGLSQIENLTERNATAQLIFGRSLEDLAPVLALTSDEINNARVQSRALGLVQSRESLVAANNFRISVDQLRLQIRAQAQEIGTNLIPIVEDLIPVIGKTVENIGNLVKGFTDLPEPVQNGILGFVAFAAALGPVLSIAGQLVTILPKLKVGLAVLGGVATGPVGLAIAGVAALGAATAGLVGWIQGVKNENAEEAYEGIAVAAGLAGKELRSINSDLEVFAGFVDSTATYVEVVDSLAEKYGKTREEIVAIGLASPTITEESRRQLTLVNSLNDRLQAERDEYGLIQAANEQITRQRLVQIQIAEQAESQRAQAETAAIQREKTRLEEVIAARKKALDDTERQLVLINARVELGLIDEKQGRAEVERLYQKEIDALLEIGFRTDQNSEGARRLRFLVGEVVKETEQAVDVTEEYAGSWEDVNFVAQETIDGIEEAQAENHEKELERIEKEKQLRIQNAQAILSATTRLTSSIGQLSNSLTNRLIANIESTRNAEVDALKAKEDSLEEGYNAEKALLDKLTDDKLQQEQAVFDLQQKLLEDLTESQRIQIEERLRDETAALKNLEKTRLDSLEKVDEFGEKVKDANIARTEAEKEAEEEKAAEIARLKRRQAILDKSIAIFNIALDTARAIIGFLANPGGLLGVGLSVAAGITGALQAGAIAAQPIPTFATGGSFIVPPGFGGDSFPITTAMVQSGERVTVEPAGGFSQFESQNPMLVQLILDGRTLAQSTVDYVNGGQVRLEATR